MAKIKEKKIVKFSEYISYIETLQETMSGSLWYRGSNNSSHHLIPGLYRHKKRSGMLDLSNLESELITRFQQRSMPFTNRSFNDPWEAIFYMQHYRLPTRLLDWTENPFIAFYFAIGNSAYDIAADGELIFTTDATVWILDPVRWNRHALSHQTYDRGILLTIDEEMKGYVPSTSISKMNNHPVALYGTHNSPRIVAQRGVFTVFGQSASGMDELYTSSRFPKDCLIKIVIPKENIKSLRAALFSYGFTESVVYPDLDGLALEIKRFFEFEV
ncbi:FRG domain-containing protein [Aquipseudomonas campi]|uniref:FRG domain-containing protein n=1 Tax=Aquipseudomonas campi TaxID=2731681 RepID=A0A6M8FEL5_9GAMM|nr:FRG domain-containing protein [Pseudomonas campi]QKE62600.1 FRG domain-containing protein [Pseudomonas campi]